jgi:hypothetical protein
MLRRAALVATSCLVGLATLTGCTPGGLAPTSTHSTHASATSTSAAQNPSAVPPRSEPPAPTNCMSNDPARVAERLATTPPTPQPTPIDGTPFMSTVPVDHATAVADLAATERVAMPEDRFWDLIGILHGSNGDVGYDLLTARLELESTKDLVAFDARLTIVLYALDDECRYDWYRQVDPSGLHFVADDDFLYFRTDTVSAGRSTWDEAVAADTLPWGTTEPVDHSGEPLLFVAENAARIAHGIGWSRWDAMTTDRFPISYETGSNVDGWSD